MIQIIGIFAANYLVWVAAGILIGLLINLLDRQNSEVVPTFISSILGAIAGGVLSEIVFGTQLAWANLTAFFLIAATSLLLAIITRLLRNQTEIAVQNNSNSHSLAYYSQLSKPNHEQDIKKILNQVEYPISNRDL